MVNFFRGNIGDSIGYTGSPLRKFSGVLSKWEVEPGQQGRSDRVKLHFVDMDVQQAIAAYPYKTTILEMPMPTQRQIESSHGLPPQSQLGVFFKSLDVVFGQTSIEKLVKGKVRIDMQATERKRPQRVQDPETGLWQDTGEFFEWLDWKCVGSGSAEGAEVQAVDAQAVLIGLIPEDGATATDIATLYMASEINGTLDDTLYNGLLDKLVEQGVLTFDDTKKYHRVEA